MILTEQIFNMTAFFPAPTRHYDVKKNIQSFLENVTMAVWEESLNEKCNLEVKRVTLQSAFRNFIVVTVDQSDFFRRICYKESCPENSSTFEPEIIFQSS